MTITLRAPRACTSRPLPLVGDHTLVPLVTGERLPYANLDHAASTSCLEAVRDAVADFLPWYASTHRGAGFASRVSTEVYERARARVHEFVGARPHDEVVFTRNTTDALNLLARAVPRYTSVVCFDTEHHAALLPWRGPFVFRVHTPSSRADAIAAADQALADCPIGPALLVIAGASNVTGELLPVRELVATARRHGARVALDAAQLAPHRPVSLRDLDVDYVSLSGHKLYAPFGSGALVGRADWLRAATPYLAGGGASKNVSRVGNEVSAVWHFGTQRHEAGSPNTIGAHALGVACETLARHWTDVERHERALLARLLDGLASVRGLHELRLFSDEADRVGTVSFVVDGFEPGWLSAVLSAEYGIGVRDGAFCAHIATRRLIARTGHSGGSALRASIGLGTTTEHIDRLVGALREIVEYGAQWQYARVNGVWTPTPDPRPLPKLA